jgi:hypothetical protein
LNYLHKLCITFSYKSFYIFLNILLCLSMMPTFFYFENKYNNTAGLINIKY